MRPTAEQQLALDLFATGKALKIQAGAGTGKTTMLRMMAESTSRRGQYVAFNRAIVEESKGKFPRTVRCHTAHGLAMSATSSEFKERLDKSQRLPSWELAKILRVDPFRVQTYTGEERVLSANMLAGLTMRSIVKFCQSADDAPTRQHVAHVKGIDAPPGHGPRSFAANDEVAAYLEPALKRAWADLRLYDGALPFAHDHYLKMWQLSRPRIYADYILFDEAQDASPVLIDVIARQEHAQLVWVGDSQQAIYEFTGAVNALANVPADNTAYLTQSFRFGQRIADVANGLLDHLHADLRLRGTETIVSTVGPVEAPKAVLTRTNAEAVRTVLETMEAGRTAHLVGGGKEITSFAKAAQRLMIPQRVEHADLACFESWAEVQRYVDEDEQGGDLKLLVNLIDEFGVETILRALDTMVPEQVADTVVSTAHKSKGRQWPTVRLGSDFAEEPDEAELRLLYVAVTRAEHRLDIMGLPQIRAMVGYPRSEPGDMDWSQVAVTTGGGDVSAHTVDDFGGQHAAPPVAGEAHVEALRAALGGLLLGGLTPEEIESVVRATLGSFS